MTEALAHDRALEELEVVALGAATPEATAGMLAHAAECADCRRELDEYTVLLATLTELMPERELNRGRSAGIRSRLLARASADIEAAGKRQVAAAALQKQKHAPATKIPPLAPDQAIRAMSEISWRDDQPNERKPSESRPQLAKSAEAGTRFPSPTVLLLWASIATVALLVTVGAMLLSPDEPSGVAEAALARFEASYQTSNVAGRLTDFILGMSHEPGVVQSGALVNR